MRIAVVSWSRRRVGGTEAYLDSVIPELLNAGHQISFWHEADVPEQNDSISLPDGVPAWCVSELGSRTALAALREWRPDVIYAHSLMQPKLEAEMLKVAPAVFFAHAYYGTCISGSKTFKAPIPTPCQRRFGWQCMMHYYPHRCGGLSPVTMLKEYRRQAKRLEHLSLYKAIVTHSTHMRDEYLQHGFAPERVHCLSYYAHEIEHGNADGPSSDTPAAFDPKTAPVANTEKEMPASWRLLFLGRMDFLKGGRLLIDALPQLARSLDRPVHVTFAGDGPERKRWERHAARVQARTPGVTVEFVGWVTGKQREALWNDSHLLIMSSVWPEPFGLVGPEAGLRSLPTVAFAVGGVTDWLKDGVNGHLAPGHPPTSTHLAEAILKCFSSSAVYNRLRRGAWEVARQFKMERHLAALLNVLEGVVGEN